jgi:hypothetical protein
MLAQPISQLIIEQERMFDMLTGAAAMDTAKALSDFGKYYGTAAASGRQIPNTKLND